MGYFNKVVLLYVVSTALAALSGYLCSVFVVSSGTWVLPWAVLPLVLIGITFRMLLREIQNKSYWYEQILDSLPTLLSVTNTDMDWTFVNRPVEKLFRKSKKEFIGKHCSSWGAAICNTDDCGIKRLNKHCSKTVFSQFDKEFRVDTQFLFNLAGEKVGHVEICTDITAIVGVAKAVKKEKAHKEALERAYKELKDAQKTLIEAEKMACLGSLVAGVAHEINTPIGVCVTASSCLQSKVSELLEKYENNEITRFYLQSALASIHESSCLIQSNLERAVNLITHFKQVAVEESLEAHYPFNVTRHLLETIRSFSDEMKKKKIEVKTACANDLVIDSYPVALRNIYSHLISNSINHGFDDFNRPHVIDIGVEDDGDEVSISYQDNGRGIDPEILPKVFEPFVTTKRGRGSSGLGAHIIYNLATQRLKGTISCQSQKNEGCIFVIRFPNSVSPKEQENVRETNVFKIDPTAGFG